MRFYGKAEAAANSILRAFQSPSSLPAAIAPVFIQRKDGSPCRSWSWANQLLVALHGHSDARGFRQWQIAMRGSRLPFDCGFIAAPRSRSAGRSCSETSIQ